MKQITVTVADARTALGLGRTSLYRLMAKGQLQKVKVGRRTLITVASVEQLVARGVNEAAR